MTDFVTFDAVVEPMKWGTSTYTIVRLPSQIMAALGDAKRVEGEFNEHPVNLAITKAPPIEDPFLWSGKSLLSEIGVAPGDVFEARLRPVDPSHVEVPMDLNNALRSAGVLEAWEALTPGKRRSLIHPVTTAKRAETRAARISKLIAGLL